MLDAETLRTKLSYNSETGEFRWKHDIMSGFGGIIVKKGDLAGVINGSGYRVITISYKMYLAHRLAWLYVTGKWPTHQIDHINGVPWDNRISNLREATSLQNMRNRKRPETNSTGFKGVSFEPKTGRFRARIRIDGKLRGLGTFACPIEAHAAYCHAAKTAHGEFFNPGTGAEPHPTQKPTSLPPTLRG